MILLLLDIVEGFLNHGGYLHNIGMGLTTYIMCTESEEVSPIILISSIYSLGL